MTGQPPLSRRAPAPRRRVSEVPASTSLSPTPTPLPKHTTPTPLRTDPHRRVTSPQDPPSHTPRHAISTTPNNHQHEPENLSSNAPRPALPVGDHREPNAAPVGPAVINRPHRPVPSQPARTAGRRVPEPPATTGIPPTPAPHRSHPTCPPLRTSSRFLAASPQDPPSKNPGHVFVGVPKRGPGSNDLPTTQLHPTLPIGDDRLPNEATVDPATVHICGRPLSLRQPRHVPSASPAVPAKPAPSGFTPSGFASAGRRAAHDLRAAS